MPPLELGKKMIRYMCCKGWRVKPLNIVYLEDANADTWQPVPGRLDDWDDVRILIKDTGEILLSSEATCEPGAYYTYKRMNPLGAFRIANDVQFLDAWKFGYHNKQLALVQCSEITGFRDGNEDGIRPGDPQDRGDHFCINQHTTGDNANAKVPSKVGVWSAGCLVGRYASTHYNKFIPILQSTGWSTFDTAIIPGDKFAQFQ